jgi:hypothetical protein
MGTWISRLNGKSICLFFDFFVVKVVQDEDRIKQLKEFYEATYDTVNNLERLFKKAGSKVHPGFGQSGGGRDKLEIFLMPVGQVRQPSTASELKCMLLTILHCIKQLHSLGYLHTDIRWPNVVCHDGSWYLIDCYDFCKTVDLARRRTVKGLRRAAYLSSSLEWQPADDLCQIVKLLDENPYRCEEFAMFRILQENAPQQVASGNWLVDDLISAVNEVEV